MKLKLIAGLLLLVWGLSKSGWEAGIDKERRLIVHGQDVPLDVNTRDLLGQELSLALLGGFRGMAATSAWMSLTGAWENKEWTRVKAMADLATTIQPKMVLFWEHGAWHLAWNASIDMETYSRQANQSRAEIEARLWIEEGRDMLLRGLQVHPNKAALYLRLADIYWQRLGDYETAADYYLQASQKEGAPAYAERFVGIALEKAGKNQEAYDYFCQLWEQVKTEPKSSQPPWQNVKRIMMELEEKLQVPEGERVF
ncbi:MAG: hypothetical protein AAFY98_07830 [Verrucomicrobiota bacterium]